MEKELIKEEYLDASNNMRHYGNMRFAQLTLFSAFTAVLLTVVFTSTFQHSEIIKPILKVVGILMGLIFFLMDERVASMFHAYRRRAEELEPLIGFKQHSMRPEGERVGSIFTSANAVRLLFSIIVVFWVASIFL